MTFQQTSREARENIEEHIPAMAAQICNFLVYGPATRETIEDALQMKVQTASARLRDLTVAGRVRDSGRRRLGRNGTSIIVWELVADVPTS